MSAKQAATEPAPHITIDDVKHRAETVADMVVSDTKSAVATVVETDAATKALIAVGVVLVVASFAYYLGSRAARGRFDDIV